MVIGDSEMSFGRKTQPETALAFARRKRGERYEETNWRANWRGTEGRKLPHQQGVRLQGVCIGQHGSGRRFRWVGG